MALRQLNLFFEGRQHNNTCRKTRACTQDKETQSHIFWECPCAVICWKWLARHWSGAEVTDSDLLGTTQWMQRNRLIFEGEPTSVEQSCVEFRVTGVRQLKAIARRDKMSPQTAEHGKIMEDCIDSLLLIIEQPGQVRVNRMQLPRESPLVVMMKSSLGF
ncbi:hypothetical protein PHMEG_00035484 [Phytophthora megakarya]|uniref:Reverse transcriptase n=2 Tax=Phytophthora megakarya TaxID=4795 RepID=A0A225URF7_9STRA|nr:hypothetical protein PHMEG_00035484 [Phytophthora megakarya]